MDKIREASVLLVDDEEVVLESLHGLFSLEGYTVDTAQDGVQALRKIGRRDFDLVVSDVKMPKLSGLDLLKKVKKKKSDTRVIIITAYGQITEAISAIKLGAYDYLTKPLDDTTLLSTVERALRKGPADDDQLNHVNLPLQELVTQDPTMLELLKLVDNIANRDTLVLLQGESGAGKSLIARYIHEKSHRREKPFVHITCGALPETLLESELFGHTKGAFTGALQDKIGLFELADGGDIFLDEISAASPALQVKLLDVLESKTFNKIGSVTPIRTDVRVIVATNTPLEELVNANAFRKDLYFRINTFPIAIPPLRNRPGDIELLCKHFIKKHNSLNGKEIQGITGGLKKRLQSYHWPGNVRELENVIQRGLIFAEGKYIDVKDVNFLFKEGNPHLNAPEVALEASLQKQEMEILKATLERFKGNKSRTAAFLGLDRSTLYKKLKTHDLS
ncbi:MAG: sigma-54-dependent transcriptional regulator [Candidatus Brocadiales bacterium]